jgi:hypothetical protein
MHNPFQSILVSLVPCGPPRGFQSVLVLRGSWPYNVAALHLLFLMFALLFANVSVHGQTNASLKKYPIGSSGCSALFPVAPGPADEGYYPEKNTLYTSFAEWEYEGKPWVFCVKVLEVKDPQEPADESDMLRDFLDYFKSTLDIMESGGYKKANLLSAKGSQPSLTDYWTDHGGNTYAVAGWANHNLLAVLYIYGEGKFPVQSLQKSFLNGIKFPAGN